MNVPPIQQPHKIVITSGYFNPIHRGHIELLELCALEGDRLIVIVNNDSQAILKKGKIVIPLEDRLAVVQSLIMVDHVMVSIDLDATVRRSLRHIRAGFPNAELVFAKGGDRLSTEIPEAAVCKELGIEIKDGFGAKVQSSSNLIP